MMIQDLRYRIFFFLGVLSTLGYAQQQMDVIEMMMKNLIDIQRQLADEFEEFAVDVKAMKTNVATLMLNQVETRSDVRRLKEGLFVFDENITSMKDSVDETRIEMQQMNGALTSLQGTLISLELGMEDAATEFQGVQSSVSKVLEMQEDAKVTLEGIKTNLSNLDEGCQALVENVNNTFLGAMTSDVLATQPQSNEVVDCRADQIGQSVERDCMDVLRNGNTTDGVYTIYPEGISDGVKVYCDQQTEGGGWTIIIRRDTHATRVDFARSFEEYAVGFGDLRGDFWLGNRILHAMTGNRSHTLRVDAINLQGETGRGLWRTFSVGSEHTQFTLSVDNYVSSASTIGDGLSSKDGKSWQSNNMKFITVDKSNGKRCPNVAGKGGWWYDSCYGANPTAPLTGQDGDDDSLNWYYWAKKGSTTYTGLSFITFKIRA